MRIILNPIGGMNDSFGRLHINSTNGSLSLGIIYFKDDGNCTYETATTII